MYQGGYYPGNSPSSNQVAPYPQYPGTISMTPNGQPFQQGGPNFPPPVPVAGVGMQEDNPCSCCCGLVTAAKVMALLNLLGMLYELLRVAAPYGTIPTDKKMTTLTLDKQLEYFVEEKRDFNDEFYAYTCQEAQTEVRTTLYKITQVLFIGGILAYLAATTGFLATVFESLDRTTGLTCANMFMYVSFLYPGWLCYILHYIDQRNLFESPEANKKCAENTTLGVRGIVGGISVAVFSVYCGLVGKGYASMLERMLGMGLGFGQPQGIPGGVAIQGDEEEG